MEPKDLGAPTRAGVSAKSSVPKIAAVLSKIAPVAGLLALLVLIGWIRLDQAKRSLLLALGYTFFLAGPILVLIPLELLSRRAGPRKSSAAWWLHLRVNLIYFCGYTLTSFALIMIFGDLLAEVTPTLDLRFVDHDNPISIVLAVLFSALIFDFFGYWLHRFQHMSRFLWLHHKLHHSDPNFDILTSYRNNWVEAGLGFLAVGVPTSLLFQFDSFDPLTSGPIVAAGLFLWSVVQATNHLNVRWHLGWGAYIYAGPQAHRIHHSLEAHHIDKNFAAFPIWDILFGTFYYPKRDEYPPTGVHGEEEISSMWESQIFTVREWWRFFRR